MLFTKSITRLFSFMMFAFISTTLMAQMPMQAPAAAPANYTDAELQQFVSAVSKVMIIQEEGQMRMINTIEETDLSVDRFNEMLMQGQQQGQTEIDATEEEMLAFTNALNAVQQQQQEMQMEMMQAITEEGLEVEKYQNIMQAYEQNPEVKGKVDKMFEDME